MFSGIVRADARRFKAVAVPPKGSALPAPAAAAAAAAKSAPAASAASAPTDPDQMPSLDDSLSAEEVSDVYKRMEEESTKQREVMRAFWKAKDQQYLRTKFAPEMSSPQAGWLMTRGRELTLVHPSLTQHLSPSQLQLFLQECYPRMSDAHGSFLEAGGNLKRTVEEPLFRLYVHMRKHEAVYFAFLSSPETHAWAERLVGVLGTWATMLRQRGDYALCADVLELDSRVLAR
jgi:hypothetical protein